MDRIVRGVDRPVGIAAFVVVVTLLAGFMVAYGGVISGEGPEHVGYFVLFVVVVVAVAVGALVGLERYRGGADGPGESEGKPS